MDALTSWDRRRILDEYLRIGEGAMDLLPASALLPFGVLPDHSDRAWRLPYVEQMLDDDLRELTNGLNQWRGSLRQWHVWTLTMGPLDEDTRWSTEIEFVIPLAFMCMFMPSSHRDRFGYIALRAMHQVLMSLDPDREDFVVGDPKGPGKKTRHVGRTEREKYLAEMVEQWPEGIAFIQALQRLDDGNHEDATWDFRNRSSHALAPRFTLGDVQMITRERRQATRLERQADDRYREVPVPDRMAVSYGFGGIPPLDMDQARTLNVDQFELARTCFQAYVALLRVAIAAIPDRLSNSDS